MIYDKIKAPDIIISKQLIVNLKTIIQTIIEQVFNLELFMKDYHKIYQQFAHQLQKISGDFQLKINLHTNPLHLVIMEFTKTVQNMSQTIQKQSIKNLALIKATKSKSNKSTQIQQILMQRLGQIKKKIKQYKRNCQQFRELQLNYITKSSDFQNIETDTIKYYSTEYFKQKFVIVTKLQDNCEKQIQKLKGQQSQLQIQFKQVKKLLIDLFQLQNKKVKQMLKYSRTIIQKLVHLESVIAQQNSIQQFSIVSEPYKYSADNFSHYTSEFLKKTKTNFLICEQIRQNFYYFLKNILNEFEKVNQKLISLHKNDSYRRIQRQKKILQQFLSKKTFQQFMNGVSEVFKFCLLIQKLTNKLDRLKILQQIINCQKLNYEYFLKESIHTLQMYKRNKKQIKNKLNNNNNEYNDQNTMSSYKQIKNNFNKFSNKDDNFNQNFQNQITHIITQIKTLFRTYLAEYPLAPSKITNHHQNQIFKIFTKKYFQVFIHPFISQNLQFKFQQSKFILQYIKVKHLANSLDNITIDLSQFPEQSTRLNTHTKKYKVGCCGITNINSQSNQNQILDSYSCALFNGILLQGRLYILKKQIRFVSLFNNKTIFGKTQIQIPKNDIFKIEQDQNILKSIIIGTSHGQIKFTSFINYPLQILKRQFLNDKLNKNLQTTSQKSQRNMRQSLIQPEIKEVRQRVIQILKKSGFSRYKNDQYTRSFVNSLKQIKCQVNIDQYPNILIIKVFYKSYESPSQIYNIKIIKHVNISNTFECKIEQQNNNGTQLMKQIFLQLAKKIAQPYKNNNLKQISQSLLLKQCQSLILQLNSFDEQEIQQQRKQEQQKLPSFKFQSEILQIKQVYPHSQNIIFSPRLNQNQIIQQQLKQQQQFNEKFNQQNKIQKDLEKILKKQKIYRNLWIFFSILLFLLSFFFY